MTREEAIYTLEQMKTWSKDLSDDEIEALVIALKALEQEPLTDVLEKIKAEIIARDRNVKTVRNDGRCLFTAVEVLLIIDKYKADKGKGG